MKNLKLFLYINAILAILFSFLSLSFNLDVSIIAFPLSCIFTVFLLYMSLKVLLIEGKISKLGSIRRLFQYEPFVFITAFVIQRAGKNAMPYALDMISVFVWLFITVFSFIILYYLNEKRVFTLNKDWEQAHKNNPPQVYKGLKRAGIEALEWIDALVQAVFTLVLLNIFIFQLYAIPSESMVPTFLVKDRVAVVKLFSGPTFPLSKVGLPYIQNYKRGDIVVFRNPHYKDDRKSEVKTFLSQFILMLTFTFVKTNTDENGELKADPLVKRIVGLHGEQIMLMDGALYARSEDTGTFKKIDEEQNWAAWNVCENGDLYNLTTNKLKIEKLPITEIRNTDIINIGRNTSQWSYTLSEAISEENSLYESVLEIEQERRSLDLLSAAIECKSLSEQFSSLAHGGDIAEDSVSSLFNSNDLYVYNLFSNVNDMTNSLLSIAGGKQWFEHFMNDWYLNILKDKESTNLSDLALYSENGAVEGESLIGGNLYDDSCFRLNIMAKLVFGRLVLRNAILSSEGLGIGAMRNDEVRADSFIKAQKLFDYIIRMDQRNMPVFPADNADGSHSYIPEHCYFMMGDNRYNSLDMRHSYERKLVPLTSRDEYSVSYKTNMEPQYVNRSRIQGKASLRFWPLSRFKLLHN